MADNKIKIGVIGAGRSGMPLIKTLSDAEFVEIVGVADMKDEAPGILLAKEKGIPTTKNLMEIVGRGTDVDILIDVTGRRDVRATLREHMQKTGNKHTIIMPELIAILMQSLASGELVESFHGYQKYS